MSSESNDYESLRDFTWSSRIHATSPLDMSVQVHFGSSGLRGSEISFLKLKPHYNLPRALDLLTSVPVPIDGSWLFSSLGFGCFNTSTFSLPMDLRPVDTCPPRSNGPDFLQPLGFLHFGNIKF
jgi:hypothetical protein